MTIILPVISYYVDEVILDYLLNSIQSELFTDINSVNSDLNQNNNIDNNNNKTVNDEIDEFKEIENWAEEPWSNCIDVDVPQWAKIEGPVFEEDNLKDFVWADDPRVQTSLDGIPPWMLLPGVDFDLDAFPWKTEVDMKDDNIEDLIESTTTIINWSDEFYFQAPLDVPNWALLPGIDYPRQTKNSPYWQYKLNNYHKIKDNFRQKVFKEQFRCIAEEIFM
ncbi:hypothetical protein LOTGIDRAFT_157575 [Lottia gigantea]|uniref:Uncharacterized protein n=1 Tax=Lottia gigantea TaxID=225164 RepID=V4B5Q9_LOTGI|nr:hypothetical protein LOTGIDRAFT_157575 [Lottia gigantea]ESP01397.1 hypothetical protein LOTGIDRAFT_157575 [Lottia gigantea]